MTYGIKTVAGGVALLKKRALPKGFFGTVEPLYGATWASKRICGSFIEKDKEWTVADVYTYLWGAHTGHALEFLVALLCYGLLYSDGAWIDEAKEWRIGWVSRIVLFNLCCELVIPMFWHYWSYVSPIYAAYTDAGVKMTPTNQYEPETGKAGMFTSSTGQLEREITFTTLGWLQSAGWQCLFTHLWACNLLPHYVNFCAHPVYSVLGLCVVTYWREIHFYFGHRGMHPWFDRKYGLMNGDVGAFLYRHVHSLHHKSYNPGPWSGLCMHPVEHLIYYSCATLPPLFICVHPLHFLYCKFHADIAPIGGHDGMEEPGGKGDFHWLHHMKFECNYGVPFPVNLDLLLGTWADYDIFKKTGELTVSTWAQGQMHECGEEEGNDKKVPLLDAESPATKGAIQEYDMSEVAKHTNVGDCWIALYGKVLNVTKFLNNHPGGTKVILDMAGKDATGEFSMIHATSGGFSLVAKWAPDAEIGVVSGYDGPAAPAPSSQAGKPMQPGALLFFPVLAIAAYLAMSP